MSDNNTSPAEPQAEDPPPSRRPEGIPDSLWRQVLNAGQQAAIDLPSVVANPPQTQSPSRSPPRRSSDLRSHTPASLRLLTTDIERFENEIRAARSRQQDADSRMVVLNEHREAMMQVVADRTRALEEIEARIGTGTDLRIRDPDGTPTIDRLRESSAALDDRMRRIEDRMRTTGLAQAAMTGRRPVYLDNLPSESAQPYTGRHHQESASETLRRHGEFQERARQIEEPHNATDSRGNADTSSAPITSNRNPPAISTSTAASGSIEQSTSARRDLERALRDYRIARRALRTHHTNEASSPGDQNTPSYQGVMAQIAEQQNHNRNRMRARGQSRSSTLDRTDAIVTRIAAAAGVGNEAWRSDDDTDTVVGLTSATSNAVRQAAITQTQSIAAMRNNLPYLGPTTTSRGTGVMSGGMRDFYRRIEERDRNAGTTSTFQTGNGPEAGNSRSLSTDQPMTDTAGFTADATEMQSGPRPQTALGPPSLSSSQVQTNTGKPSYNASRNKAKITLRYLSQLKDLNNDGERSLVVAQNLGIDGVAEILAKDKEVDLPSRIDELPRPQYSSWLEAGMSWKGIQKGGVGKPDTEANASTNILATGPLFESGRGGGEGIEERILRLRAWRHREQVRAERQDTGRPGQIGLAPDDSNGLLRGYTARNETLADVERHLSDLLEEEERRLNRLGNDEWGVSSISLQPRQSTTSSMAETKEIEDRWPVKVTIHEANWKTMTLSGTMVASQILNRSRQQPAQAGVVDNGSNNGESENKNELDMETFFDGEIIDFRTHELETVAEKPGYKVGGLVIDLKYWSRIGPFKTAVTRQITTVSEKKAADAYERLGITGSSDEQRETYKRTFPERSRDPGHLNKEEVDMIVYDVMANCLGSRKWIDEAIGEGGWILMRWKERCFTTPPKNLRPTASGPSPFATNPSATTALPQGPMITNRIRNMFATNRSNANPDNPAHRPAPTSYTTIYSSENDPERVSWGLTIQGFYYVALNRFSGQIQALYFDSGSHPFQELELKPAAACADLTKNADGDRRKKVLNNATSDNSDVVMEDTTTGTGTCLDEAEVDIDWSCIGIRSEFGSWAFR